MGREDNKMVCEYIKNNIGKTIRENKEDNGTLIGLPYPYTVPCADGMFQEMYYWDTYFTNVGLCLIRAYERAKNNVDNMIYLVERFGYMPNGNRTYYLNRSQPPFLSFMVRDIYEHYKDKEWLGKAYDALETEYSFWMTRRMTETGLNQYGGTLIKDEAKQHADRYRCRTGLEMKDTDDMELYRHYISFCESGWDINPRWDFESYNYIQPELNSLLYGLEKNMEYFSKELGNRNEAKWSAAADRRLKLMNEYLVGENGLFCDYNFVKKTKGKIFSAAAFYPLFAGCASKEQAALAVSALNRIEGGYGVFACEKNDAIGSYQWDYPNSWPPVTYIVIRGLIAYGYTDDALRIAEKYIHASDKIFKETGCLWEKYNADEGSVNVTHEYETPPMIGWCAGAYLYCKSISEGKV